MTDFQNGTKEMISYARILQEGYDGKICYVHARTATDGNGKFLMTAQKMDVAGSDCFFPLESKCSTDGGKTWTDFTPQTAFTSIIEDGIRRVACDMTPFYHKKTGKFLAIGHTAQYFVGKIVPVDANHRSRITPYAVFDEASGQFGEVRHIAMPNGEKYSDCGSGCSQCLELADGDMLIPVSFGETKNGIKQNTKVVIIRCSFDGETLAVKEIGNELEVADEVRGIGECSVIFCRGQYWLTIRGDRHGYFSTGTDGLHYTQPAIWRWEDGEIVPTYNTQSHFFTAGGELYLVYTRKDGKNDHVFRHRAPLYATKINTKTCTLVREAEWAVIPERGARLGNFGVCTPSEEISFVTVTEWMQPKGCEQYGSDNALWFAEITKKQ